MRQHSNFSGQNRVEAASADSLSWTTTATPRIAPDWQVQMELQHERCLNRLQERLNEWVTAYLATTHSQDDRAPELEAKIFQTLVQALSEVLIDKQIAIFRPLEAVDDCRAGGDRPTANLSVQSAGACFSLNHLASGIASLKSPLATEILALGKPIRLELGEILTCEDLQDLQTHAPESIWQIKAEQTLQGWLLLYPGSVSSGDRPIPASDSDLIERSIHHCIQALYQIRLIDRQFQKQQELIACNHELTQTNKLKSEFLANTSHEIRTPLSSILGFTHLLKAQGFSPTNLRHQEYLNIILTSGQHLLALINDILDLSKIEANQLDLNWEIVEVQTICQTALTLVREKASDKGLTLKLEIAPQVSTLIADSLRLKQMLFNLLSNAIKFTLKGSVGVQVDQTNGFLHFTIWDTGTGISKEQQRLLFRPYSQIANAAVGYEQGTGLGLALTQKLAELHGGGVDLISQIDQGSRFTVSLPLAPPASDARFATEPTELHSEEARFPKASPLIQIAEEKSIVDSALPNRAALTDSEPPTKILPDRPASPGRAERSQPKSRSSNTDTSDLGDRLPEKLSPIGMSRSNHLLLVEDNIHNAKLMLTFLSKAGYEITWVKDGSDMWESLERSLPALILMDVHLPVVDGLTLTRQLRSDERYQAIPIITQTAMAMTGDRALCLEAGATNYISKPIDLDTLAQLVSQYVKRKNAIDPG